MNIPLPLWRAALIIYALTLLTATHWPRLAFDDSPIPRTDLWLHFGAFAVLALLAFPSRIFRGERAFARTLVLLGLFAAFDESTQAIPALHRHTSFLDFLADLGGITIGSIIWLGYTRLARR